MPVKRTLYYCKFGCGIPPYFVEQDMIEHEERCGLNPETKSCPTCKHEYFERFNAFTRYCALNQLPPNEIYAANCKYWKEREDD